MNISLDCTIDLNGLELEVTVEADCQRTTGGVGYHSKREFTWGDCTVLRVDHEDGDILPQLSLVQIAELEKKALEHAQTQEDDRGYQG